MGFSAKWAKWLLLFLLLIPQATAVCSTYLDCPEPDCPGSLRLCVNSECINTYCSFSQDASESFAEPFKPYEKALNVSLIEEEGEFRSGILAAFGITDVFSGLGMGFAVIASALLILILLYLFKSKSKLLFALGLAVVFLLAGLLFASVISGENLFRRAFLFGPGDWDSQSFRDFVPEKIAESVDRTPVKVPISRAEIVSVSSLFKKGVAYRLESRDKAPISVMILELYRSVDVANIPSFFVGDVDSSRLFGSEKVYFGKAEQGLKRAVWDDDRYIFIVQSSSDDMLTVISKIISRYPVSPSKPALSISDSAPPVVRFEKSLNGSLASSFTLAVEIDDSLSGVDLASITSNTHPFHPFRECETLSNSTVLCVWSPDLLEGANDVTLTVTDKSGNSVSKSIVMTLDTQRPLVTVWPKKGFVTDENLIEIEISDAIAGVNISSVKIWLNGDSVGTGLSGLDDHYCVPATDAWICSFENVLHEGSNVLRFEAMDNLDNVVIIKQEIIYDSHPPDIAFFSNKLDSEESTGRSGISFKVTDTGVGVSINGITMNADDFVPLRDCRQAGDSIICVYNGSRHSGMSVTAVDRAGLSRSSEYPY